MINKWHPAFDVLTKKEKEALGLAPPPFQTAEDAIKKQAAKVKSGKKAPKEEKEVPEWE